MLHWLMLTRGKKGSPALVFQLPQPANPALVLEQPQTWSDGVAGRRAPWVRSVGEELSRHHRQETEPCRLSKPDQQELEAVVTVLCSNTQSQETASASPTITVPAFDTLHPFLLSPLCRFIHFFFFCFLLGEDEVDAEGRWGAHSSFTKRGARFHFLLLTGTRQRENPSILPAPLSSTSQSQSLQGGEPDVTQHEDLL